MSKQKNKDDDYEDSGLELVDAPIIYIPRFLEDLMYDIDDNKSVDKLAEFSIFCKAKIEGFTITLSNDYYIPKQVVHGAEVDYDVHDPRPNDEFNTVIHRHPDKLHSFSQGDDTYINRNFDVSLLWTRAGSFVKGQYNLYQNRMRCAIDCDFEVRRPRIKKIHGLDKIKKWVYVAPKYTIIEDGKSRQSNGLNYNQGSPINWEYTRDHLPPASEDLNGSSIVDNEGNLVDYNTAMGNDEFNASLALPVDFRTVWRNYFEQHYPKLRDEVVDLAVFFVKMLDDVEKDYTERHNYECTEYFDWMGIASYAVKIQQYNDKSIEVFGKICAEEWVAGKVGEVRKRIKTILHMVFKDETEKIERGEYDTGDGSKTTTTSEAIH